MQGESIGLTLEEIKKRAASSFFSLTARQIALRAISFITLNIILAKVLPVETLGIFNIATSIITFFAFFSDIGLAASLIQKKGEVTFDDIKTVFTIQQTLVGILSLIIIFGAPLASRFYGLEDNGIWLIRVLGISFFLSSLKVVPSVLLERNLKFNPLVVVEIAETLTFNLLLMIFVFKGWGIWGFSLAALSRGMVGTALLYILAPVKLGLGIKKEAASKLLSFGIPFQLNSLLALLKDRLVPLVIAGMVGPLGIGFITWAQALAFLPLEIMSIMIRISFPAFSRLQEDKDSLTKAIEKSLFVTSLFTYPVLFGVAALLPALVAHVVSSKWLPALPIFYLFAFTSYLAVLSTTFTNALNAVGHIKTTLKLMVFWTVSTWILTPALVFFLGFIGAGISSFIISFSSIVTIILIKRILPVKILEAIFLPTLASIFMGVVVYFFSLQIVQDYFTLLLAVLVGAVVYGGIIVLLGKNRMVHEIRSLRSA